MGFGKYIINIYMPKQRMKTKLKQKGGNTNNYNMMPQQPPTPERQGQWIWQDYNPIGFGDVKYRVEQEIDETGKALKKLSKMKKMAYYGAAFLFIISYLGVTETTVFNQSNLIDPEAAIWSPVFIIGFALTLLVAMIPTIDTAYGDMVKEELKFNGKGPYNGILGKLKWFFTSPFIFVILLIGCIVIIGGQLIGFINTTSIDRVRDTLHNKMSGTWRGIWSVNAFSTLLFIFFMFRYPFPNYVKSIATGKNVRLYDNIHAKGIMLNLLIISLFFTIYFTVEFNTKFNVI